MLRNSARTKRVECVADILHHTHCRIVRTKTHKPRGRTSRYIPPFSSHAVAMSHSLRDSSQAANLDFSMLKKYTNVRFPVVSIFAFPLINGDVTR